MYLPTPVVYYRTIIFAYAGVTLRDMLISVQLRIQKIIARGVGEGGLGLFPSGDAKGRGLRVLEAKPPQTLEY